MNDMPFYVMEYCPGPYLYGTLALGEPPLPLKGPELLDTPQVTPNDT